MQSPRQIPSEVEAELVRRHKAAATTIGGLLVAVVLLSVVAFLGRSYFRQQSNPSLVMAIRIAILIVGLGSIVLRRTRFSTMRLQDIAGLHGATGLLQTLEKTTLQLGVLGAAIAAMGFVGTVMTGSDLYTYWAGLIAIVLLVFCYPTRRSWEGAVRQFTGQQDDVGPAPQT